MLGAVLLNINDAGAEISVKGHGQASQASVVEMESRGEKADADLEKISI